VGEATELVLGLPRDLVPGGLDWHGVRGVAIDRYLGAVAAHGTYRPRAGVEDDPTWKQVIPYLLLRDAERIFLMKRTKAGADARLHDRYTIGIGGHVNPEDTDVMGGLRREWAEEIEADFEPEFTPLGVLNDDSNPVGAVHLGLVFSADAGGRPVGVREIDKLSGAFATLDEVAAVVDRMETWSSLLVEYLRESAAPR
jgi:predicted NUDIX family phosphoesterase